jgi:hypothetical protein
MIFQIYSTGTIIGTPPNLVLVDQFDKFVRFFLIANFISKYPRAVGLVSFLVWMEFSVPLMVVSLFACWLVLVMMFIGRFQFIYFEIPFPQMCPGASHLLDICRRDTVNKKNEAVNAVVRKKYANLPPFR